MSTATPDTAESRELALTAAGAASDKLAEDIAILDIGDLLAITDFFVIASARNEIQLGTVMEAVEQRVRERYGRRPRRREGSKDTGWMIVDYGEVVFHGFSAEQRSYYDLERLWSDAPRVEWAESGAGRPAGGAGMSAGAGGE